MLLAAVDPLCGIALLCAVWWARRATVVVMLIALLYHLVTFLGLDTLLPQLGNQVYINFPPRWDSALSALLEWGRDIVIIYFLTLSYVAVTWPRNPEYLYRPRKNHCELNPAC